MSLEPYALEQEDSIEIKVYCGKCKKEMNYSTAFSDSLITIDAFCTNCMNSVKVKVK